jgi:hypothetical protein
MLWRAALVIPEDAQIPSTRMVIGWKICQASFKKPVANRPTAKRSRSTWAMWIWATSICWCRRGSTPTAPISSAPRSAISSIVTARQCGNRSPGTELDLGLRHYRPRKSSNGVQVAGSGAAHPGARACRHCRRRVRRSSRATPSPRIHVLGALQASPCGKGRAWRTGSMMTPPKLSQQPGVTPANHVSI